MQHATIKLLPSISGKLGILQLNNASAYHALTLDMVYAAQEVLQVWYNSDELQAVLWHSSNDTKRPTFCSGGDVKSLALECRDEPDKNHGVGTPGVLSADFFRQEYYLNHALAQQNNGKIQISLWNGLVFGGGVGISLFGKYRVATEHTLFAMPETAIGFIPDVGALWALPRILQDHFFVVPFISLTGQRLQPADLIYTGLATHYVPSQDLTKLQAALVEASESTSSSTTNDEDPFASVLQSFHRTPPEDPKESFLAQNALAMKQVFGTNVSDSPSSLQELQNRLQSLDSEFGQSTLQTLQKMSPTSCQLTLEMLHRGSPMDLAQHLHMEYRLSQHLMKSGSDFHEGIRATLLERKSGQPPQWNPASMDQVDVASLVLDYFEQPIEHEWNVQESPFSSSSGSPSSNL